MLIPRGYVCLRAKSALEITGSLNKPFWAEAPWTDLFVDIEGERRPAPRFQTRAKLLWDDDYLYIGAELEEPHVWATLTEHDSVIFYDNDFEIFLDPDGDNHNYYEIEINALNTTWDLRLPRPYRDGGPALNEWEIPGFRSAIAVDGTLNDPSDVDRGWSLEIAIPWAPLCEFAACACPPRNGDQWRINFSRVEWDVEIQNGKYVKIPGRPEHNWVWSPQYAIDMHRPERWGFLQFSDQAVGEPPFVLNSDFPAQDRLMGVYHAQRAFHEQHNRWAESVGALGIEDTEEITLRITEEGYTAECTTADGSLWCVRQDSLLWRCTR